MIKFRLGGESCWRDGKFRNQFRLPPNQTSPIFSGHLLMVTGRDGNKLGVELIGSARLWVRCGSGENSRPPTSSCAA